MGTASWLIDGLLELLSPERCTVCDRDRSAVGWSTGVAGRAPGLRGWHAPHLCAGCLGRWRRAPCRGRVAGLPLWSALPESAELVRTVGVWKYQGIRGLARPLAALLPPVLVQAAAGRPAMRLVPVPLHGRRRRERGFDQCHQLAVLAGRAAGLPVVVDVLARRRATRQQASCPAAGDARARNVAGCFAARVPDSGEPADLVLLDDLATTGATLAAAAAAAAGAGWRVAALVALGQAWRLREGGRG